MSALSSAHYAPLLDATRSCRPWLPVFDAVAEQAGIDRDGARPLTDAVLETLAEPIAPGDADDLAARLPVALHPPMHRGARRRRRVAAHGTGGLRPPGAKRTGLRCGTSRRIRAGRRSAPVITTGPIAGQRGGPRPSAAGASSGSGPTPPLWCEQPCARILRLRCAVQWTRRPSGRCPRGRRAPAAGVGDLLSDPSPRGSSGSVVPSPGIGIAKPITLGAGRCPARGSDGDSISAFALGGADAPTAGATPRERVEVRRALESPPVAVRRSIQIGADGLDVGAAREAQWISRRTSAPGRPSWGSTARGRCPLTSGCPHEGTPPGRLDLALAPVRLDASSTPATNGITSPARARAPCRRCARRARGSPPGWPWPGVTVCARRRTRLQAGQGATLPILPTSHTTSRQTRRPLLGGVLERSARAGVRVRPGGGVGVPVGEPQHGAVEVVVEVAALASIADHRRARRHRRAWHLAASNPSPCSLLEVGRRAVEASRSNAKNVQASLTTLASVLGAASRPRRCAG